MCPALHYIFAFLKKKSKDAVSIRAKGKRRLLCNNLQKTNAPHYARLL
jgi:hypothetical protein